VDKKAESTCPPTISVLRLTRQTPEDLRTGPRSMDKHPDTQLSLLPRLPSEVTQSHRARRFTIRRGDRPSVLSHRRSLTTLRNDGLFDRLVVRRDIGRDLVQALPDHLGDEQEVIVVYDDQVTGLVQLGDPLGKQEVGLLVSLPCWVRGGERDGRVLPEQVVEQGPESCRAGMR
jgi:hypothetical protein